jgi:uncharacterized protein with GYD domain
MEGLMNLRTVITLSPLIIGLTSPVLAQESHSHLYMIQVKFSPQAVTALIDNPQDRSVYAAKLVESFGGKLLAYYVTPPGEYDAVIITEFFDETGARASSMVAWSLGFLAKQQVTPLISTIEWKAAMERAQQTKTEYTPPTQKPK